MNREMLPSPDRDDFDGPPEQELATLFASSAPPVRPVDVASLYPWVATRESSHAYVLPLRWSNPMFRRIAALVSATAGVVAVVGLFILIGSSARISFAEVMDKVARTRTVTFKQAVRIPGRSPETLRIAILADGHTRVDMPNGDYTAMDMKGKALAVSPRDKKATIMLGLDTHLGLNPYEMIRGMVSETSERLPDEVIDGRKVSVFRVEWNEQVRKQSRGRAEPMKVWVDPQTTLPIRMQPIRQDDKETMATDFVFDEPLDPSLFSLDPPAGYAVTAEGLANLPAPPEKPDLLAPEVIPGVGLGPVKFGMSKEDVIKILGKPDTEGREGVEYPSRGYGFTISPQRGVVAITLLSQEDCAFKVRDFAGKTKEGIGIGSSLQDLEKAFGKPDSVEQLDVPGTNSKYVLYMRLGLSFTLFDDKVIGFMLEASHY